jgi:hypothetical protein
MFVFKIYLALNERNMMMPEDQGGEEGRGSV